MVNYLNFLSCCKSIGLIIPNLLSGYIFYTIKIHIQIFYTMAISYLVEKDIKYFILVYMFIIKLYTYKRHIYDCTTIQSVTATIVLHI